MVCITRLGLDSHLTQLASISWQTTRRLFLKKLNKSGDTKTAGVYAGPSWEKKILLSLQQIHFTILSPEDAAVTAPQTRDSGKESTAFLAAEESPSNSPGIS